MQGRKRGKGEEETAENVRKERMRKKTDRTGRENKRRRQRERRGEGEEERRRGGEEEIIFHHFKVKPTQVKYLSGAPL